MPAAPSQLFLGFGDEGATLKIVGRANFQLGGDLKRALGDIRSRNAGAVRLLTDRCLIMDSTFIGILAAFARERNAAGAPLTLVNPPPQIVETLDNLSILDLFHVSTETDAEEPADLARVTASATDKRELTRASLEAHETLIEMNTNNATKFKDVADFLRRELGDR